MKIKKPVVGFFGVSGCAGCLLSVLFQDCFKQLTSLLDIKSFPFIKEESYKGEFDYCFIEGTVCFDEDIVVLNELRKRSKKIVALGSCACTGGVPSIKNFLDSEKTMKLVYPTYNHLKAEPPTPISSHIKVDYYLPQCPPSKEEIVEFVKFIATGREFTPYRSPVCLECRKLGNKCLLTEGKMCLGPITNGGCNALCPSNKTTCYGCRGPCPDANMEEYIKMIREMGYTGKNISDKLNTFSGLAFKEKAENISTWLEK